MAAHRDDVEQTCGGTLLKMARQGACTGILDLTQGELGTRGSAESRAREAGEAARILQVAWREVLDIPDGRVENTYPNRVKIARVIREQRPRVVILPYYHVRPTFVVDITAEFEAKLESIYAYKEQFSDQPEGSKDFPAHAEIRERVASMAHSYGMLVGVKYGEPFFQKEVGLVDDLRLVPVQSI